MERHRKSAKDAKLLLIIISEDPTNCIGQKPVQGYL